MKRRLTPPNFSFTFFMFFFVSVMLTPQNSIAQMSDKISGVKYGTAKESEPLNITVELYPNSPIRNITVAYKPFGETEYVKEEMIIEGSNARFTFPADALVVPNLEYYLIMQLADGKIEVYPEGAPSNNLPLQISVAAATQKDKEIIFLSPEKNEMTTFDDLFISVSLLRSSEKVDKRGTKIFIDGRDVTSYAVISDDLILLQPKNTKLTVGIGVHFLTVELYDSDGKLYHSSTSEFQIRRAEALAARAEQFNYRMSLQGESRNEQFSNVSTWYNNLGVSLSGSYGSWRFGGEAYATSEEKKFLQPQNRYSASLESDWLNLKAGDSYPRYPNLIIEGKRIRGVTGGIRLGFFNIEATYGQTERALEGKLLYGIPRDSAALASNIISIDSLKYGDPFGLVELGTFSRNIFAIRPSFGSGENFQLGFSYLHASDDKESIEFGAKPSENVVLGTDLMFGIDSKRILFTSQAAVSVYNSDISTGTLTDSEIDSVFGKDSFFDVDPQQIKDIKNLLGNFITVNQFIGPKNPQELASLAAEAALSLNYFNNSIKASYIYRGNDFVSFGQSYLRTDVKGFNLIDRVRMFDNRLFVSLGYERLEDNLQETKPATTTFQTLNTSVSLFPRIDFPNITVAYTRYFNQNGLSITDPINQNNVVDDETNRFMVQLSYDLMLGVRHNTALSFLTSQRDDKSLRNSDVQNSLASLSVNSTWSSSFVSYFSFVFNSVEITDTKTDYLTLSLGGKYKLFSDKLELSGAFSPSFGDFERQAVDLVGQYNILSNLNLILSVRFFRMSNQSNNSTVSLMTRFNL